MAVELNSLGCLSPHGSLSVMLHFDRAAECVSIVCCPCDGCICCLYLCVVCCVLFVYECVVCERFVLILCIGVLCASVCY